MNTLTCVCLLACASVAFAAVVVSPEAEVGNEEVAAVSEDVAAEETLDGQESGWGGGGWGRGHGHGHHHGGWGGYGGYGRGWGGYGGYGRGYGGYGRGYGGYGGYGGGWGYGGWGR